MKVYKHLLDWGDTVIGMTGDPVYFAMQDGCPHVWAEHRNEEPMRERYFRIVGTGHDIEGDVWHIGSLQDGPFVWHLYQFIK